MDIKKLLNEDITTAGETPDVVIGADFDDDDDDDLEDCLVDGFESLQTLAAELSAVSLDADLDHVAQLLSAQTEEDDSDSDKDDDKDKDDKEKKDDDKKEESADSSDKEDGDDKKDADKDDKEKKDDEKKDSE